MYKKNSWIVALLVALSFSIFFIGCIDPLAVEPPDEETYTEFELTKFNAWGGNAENQAGWGSDGAKWDNGKKTVESIGLTAEMLQSAKYLVVEVNDGFPKNNFETIWSSWDADGEPIGDWQQFSNITGSGGDLNPGFGTREGNVLKLEMAKILKSYSLFKDSATASITLLIQHWGNGGTGACIKSAKLLISDKKEPFVAVTGITMPATSGAMSLDISLGATVAPDNATLQRIIWSIAGFLPEGDADEAANWLTIDNTSAATYASSKAALLAKVDFKKIDKVVINAPGYSYIDYSVYPPEEVDVDAETTTIVGGAKSSNIIVGAAAGTVKVKAIILGGATEGGDDFTKDFTIEIASLIPYNVPKSGGGFFYVDLNDWETQTPSGAGINDVVPLAVTAADKITVPYTENLQRVNFKLTDAQVTALAIAVAANSVKIEIDGEVTEGTGDSFRHHIGNALTGANWNATSGSGDNDLSSILTSTQTFTANASSEGALNYFILQHRTATAVTIEIKSIKIIYGGVAVDVDGTVQTVLVKSGGSNPGEVSLVTDGYQVSFAGGYGNSYGIFEVDFGTDKLSDFAKIEFDYVGISGDVGWKKVRVFAFNTEKTGYFGTGGSTDQVAVYDYESDGVGTDGKTLVSISESIGGVVSTITSSKVWFIITLHSDPAVFNVTKIKFVK
jgi:hypothetical protein